jgi:hypothetical protein
MARAGESHLAMIRFSGGKIAELLVGKLFCRLFQLFGHLLFWRLTC